MAANNGTLRLRREKSKSVAVAWHGVRATEQQVHTACVKALGLSVQSNVTYRDSLGCVTTLCVALPSGLTLDARLRTMTCNQSTLREQFIKFENVQAHLANERTWLAWVRTALSALTVALSTLALLGDSKAVLTAMLFLLGGSFMLSVFTMFLTGWLRYGRTRDVLMLTQHEVPPKLHRSGLGHQAGMVCLLFTILSASFLLLGK